MEERVEGPRDRGPFHGSAGLEHPNHLAQGDLREETGDASLAAILDHLGRLASLAWIIAQQIPADDVRIQSDHQLSLLPEPVTDCFPHVLDSDWLLHVAAETPLERTDIDRERIDPYGTVWLDHEFDLVTRLQSEVVSDFLGNRGLSLRGDGGLGHAGKCSLPI